MSVARVPALVARVPASVARVPRVEGRGPWSWGRVPWGGGARSLVVGTRSLGWRSGVLGRGDAFLGVEERGPWSGGRVPWGGGAWSSVGGTRSLEWRSVVLGRGDALVRLEGPAPASVARVLPRGARSPPAAEPPQRVFLGHDTRSHRTSATGRRRLQLGCRGAPRYGQQHLTPAGSPVVLSDRLWLSGAAQVVEAVVSP